MARPNAFNYEPLTREEHGAIRALNAGEADAYEQRLALKAIVTKLSRAHDLPYVPGSFDETSFLNGRSFVGKELLKYTNLPIEEE